MKNLFIALLSIFVFSAGSIQAQGFNSVTSPDGIYVIAVGDNGLLFRSSNGGNSFAQLTSGSDDFKNVCSVGDNVWFCGEGGKVFSSSKVVSSVTQNTTGTSNTLNGICFVDANTGFTCGDGGVMYKTVNGGTNWTSSGTGLPSVDLTSVSFKDANNGVVVGDNGTIYVTVDGGSSWTPVASGTTRNLLDANYYSDGYVVAGEYGVLLVKPTSSSITSINTKIRSDVRGISGTSINSFHIAGGGGFIRNNIGPNPDLLNFEVNPMMANLVDIHYANSTQGFAVSSLNKAIIRTTNGGQSWDFTNGVSASYSWVSTPGASGSFLGMNICRHPFINNTYFVALGTKVFVSRNNGDSWTQISTITAGSNPHSFYVSSADTNVWLVATDATPDKVMRTTNYGSSWTEIISQEFSNYGQPLEMDPHTPGVFYFAPDGGNFYKSSDNGASFSQVSSYPFRSPCDILVSHADMNTIFVADGVTSASQPAEIVRSTNGGVNWTIVHTNTGGQSEIPSIANTQLDVNLMRATNWSGSNIYKSTSAGSTWSLERSTGFSGWGSNFCEEDPNVYMSGSWSSGPSSWTLNGGTTWTTLNNGLNGSGGFMLLPEKGIILGHAGSSVYKFQAQYSVTTEIHEVVLNTGIPRDFSLLQNYPNPFNPSTKIRYDLAKTGIVKLTVYDQLGRQVAELVNGSRNAGAYEVEFNGSNLASGIYFYKLEVPGQTFTKKMILVK